MAETVRNLLRRKLRTGLNENLGQTFLIVTHDPLVSDRTRRTIRLKDGRIESDTRQEDRLGRPAWVSFGGRP